MALAKVFEAARGQLGAGSPDRAIALYRQALSSDPREHALWTELADVLERTGRIEEAADALRQALALKEDARAYSRLGVLLALRSRLPEAETALRRAIELDPALALAHDNLGTVLQSRERVDEAIESYRRAIALAPSHAMSHNNLGSALATTGRYAESIECFRRTVELDRNNALAWQNLGLALRRCGRSAEALDAFRSALAIAPNFIEAHSALFASMTCCDDMDPAAIYREHAAWGSRHADPLVVNVPRYANARDPDRRLRIGYVSPDFRRHAVAHFAEPILANHDHARYEIFCYSISPKSDEVTERFKSYAAHWRDAYGTSDDELAKLIRDDGIDLLIDLAGHTTGARMLALARRPAPVQITYVGYANTTGLKQIRYRLTDAIADPPGQTEHLHTEELVRLPRFGWCYRAPDDAPEVSALPAVSNGSITFGSLNSLNKISPKTIALWSRTLLAIPNSRLLMKNLHFQELAVRDQVVQWFVAQGIGRDRLQMVAPTESPAEHLAYYHQVDIALDPLPYSGTTSTCEALWMGVPVITRPGITHPARVSASLLTAVGHPEWIASSEADFVSIAERLVGDLPQLSQVRGRLRQEMQNSALMDAVQFTRDLESVYRDLWKRWCAE
jgi:predicted O-linked N-acetylglucosamine transferase (SPINDLY family)